MKGSCPIEVIDMLREREAEFMRVWQCEQKVLQLLGVEEFPFSMPPDLPSRRKVAKGTAKPVAPKKPKEVVNAGQHDMPKLEEGENAYRLVFVYNGNEESSFQTDREFVRSMLSIKSSEFELLSVETVNFTDMEHWEPKRKLWSRGVSEEE